ncbi:pyridoxamine 5'-phosphate oxidase family protein [Nocardioides marmorisolisilvae]|uniref:PPOX class F420-dependent oxidoreductase n=1 Tax=Nocardioides marmorisolisilvae TaxID=1542737 RepID=A0A3N0E079_9ACTN|nr:PPOX class F420-dependent oxidoreductase [Nocardioides marmorisolisilvae]RNL81269.1 PPOX class F420-dependent oxidoreductase [Nocardioides marmorisolisilvae]
MSLVLPRSSAFLDFWIERRLCTVTTLRPDGSPHVVPMGVVIDPETDTAWAITSKTSRKARNLADGGPIAVCCVDGRSWSTIEGTATVSDDPKVVAEAERRYAERYKVPRENPSRVAIRISVTKVIGNVG